MLKWSQLNLLLDKQTSGKSMYSKAVKNQSVTMHILRDIHVPYLHFPRGIYDTQILKWGMCEDSTKILVRERGRDTTLLSIFEHRNSSGGGGGIIGRFTQPGIEDD